MRYCCIVFCVLSFPLCYGQSQGLKSIDYKETTTAEKVSVSESPTLTAEQMKNLLESVEKIKASQDAQAKALEELDKDD